ncbi:Hypothetical predicted protein [Pelobates cultripes]|uniref:Uncharacterized protein n=1 Tax=Pelobates cultripes TaxID=61616 RepID=A0AAD1S080_PELCU|nr:Hypothetical predicted protein [Pelobates cultripes]
MSQLAELLPDSSPAVNICRYTTTHLLTFGLNHNVRKSVLSFTQTVWPATTTEDYESYYRKRMELAVNDNCLMGRMSDHSKNPPETYLGLATYWSPWYYTDEIERTRLLVVA